MTTRRYPRTLDEAFPDRSWGDPAVMRAVLDKPSAPMDFLPAWYVQAAEAATELGADQPRAQTVGLLQRIRRAVRRALINRKGPNL